MIIHVLENATMVDDVHEKAAAVSHFPENAVVVDDVPKLNMSLRKLQWWMAFLR